MRLFQKKGMFLLFAALVSLPAGLLAEGQQKVSGEIKAGGRIFTKRPSYQDRGKFEAYRDYPKGAVLEEMHLQYDAEKPYRLELEMQEPGEQDQHFLLRASKLGKTTFEFEWDQAPHVFSNTGASPYTETRRGIFDLSGDIQARLQRATAANRPILLSDFLAVTPSVNLKTRWDSARFGFEWTPAPHWTLQTRYNFTQKNGSRPIGTTFYFTNQVELPEPIDQNVHDFELSADWNNNKGYFSFGYGLSAFQNNVDSLTWDNPLRSDDAVGGSSRGRLVLAPDNLAHMMTLSAGVHLPWKSQLRGTFSYGLRFQNDVFYPHTINTALTSSLLTLPRSSLEGSVHTRLANLQWTAHPLRKLGVDICYRLYNLDDKTQNVTFNGHVSGDTNLVGEEASRAHFDFIKQNAKIDLNWHLAKKLDLKTGYEWEHWNRNGYHREVPNASEHTPRMTLDFRPASWLWLRTSYAYSMRFINAYNTFAHLAHTVNDEVGPTSSDAQDVSLRKLDESDRNRHKGDILLSFSPVDRWSFTPSFSLIRNIYPNSTLGLQKEFGWSSGADMTWSPTDRVSFYANYMREQYDTRQRSRYREPAAQLTNTTYDWIANNADLANIGTFSMEAVLKPKILTLHLGGDVTHAISRMRATNPTTPAGGSAAQNIAATVENFPDIKDLLYRLEASFKYNIKERWFTKLAYIFETYNTSNFQQEGIGVYNGALDAASNTSIYLGAQIRDYSAHQVAVTAGYRFD